MVTEKYKQASRIKHVPLPLGQSEEEQGESRIVTSPRTEKKQRSSDFRNPLSLFGLWICKSLRSIESKARLSNRFSLKKLQLSGIVANGTGFYDSPWLGEEKQGPMNGLIEQTVKETSVWFDVNVSEFHEFGRFGEEKIRECISSSPECLKSSSEQLRSCASEEESCSVDEFSDRENSDLNYTKPEFYRSSIAIEMMKEKFSKLLLGEDMSGSGNGVCSALAVSNAITNLSATVFGQLWRLEPLPAEKKAMWRREIEWLLCVSKHIVEMVPTWHTFPGGSKLEVMTCQPRSDLCINLPALCKLDNMLLETLDGLENTEFWYVDQGMMVPTEVTESTALQTTLKRQEEKWWLPIPRVPPGGLSEATRKQLQKKRECTNQILKATMSINNAALAAMEVPQSYLCRLPKNGRVCVGEMVYRHMSSDQFNPESVLDCLNLSSEHHAMELADRIEASIYVWHRKTSSKLRNNMARSNPKKASWDLIKEFIVDAHKLGLLADRAQTLLLCLKHRFPVLPQTILDSSKLQHNKDIGKSILESYSRVLESLAFNIMARIDDLLHVDDLTRNSDSSSSSISEVHMMASASSSIPFLMPISSTPCNSAIGSPSPTKGDRSPFMAVASS